MPVFEAGYEFSIPSWSSKHGHLWKPSSATLDLASVRTLNQSAVRQFLGCGLYRPPRGHQESYSLEGSNPDNFMDWKLTVQRSLHSTFQGWPTGKQPPAPGSRGMGFYTDIFHLICKKWGTLDVDILAPKFNSKLPIFVARTKDPLPLASDALIILWSEFKLVYIFPPVLILPCLLKKIEQKICPFCNSQYLLCQGSLFHLALSLALTALGLDQILALALSILFQRLGAF